jgi:hypothetical protein
MDVPRGLSQGLAPIAVGVHVVEKVDTSTSPGAQLGKPQGMDVAPRESFYSLL